MDTVPVVMEVPPCPVEDCTIPVDLILQSSNGDKFGAHQNNLQSFGQGFPLSDSVVTDITTDIPVLDESTDVLRLMLCFMHHAPQPDLRKLPFKTVAQFADAAEKYFMFSAMAICKMYMSHKVKDHPAAVFGYASKNRYDDIANEAAPLTLNVNSKIVSKYLSPEQMFRWFKYRERYLVDFRLIYDYVPPPSGVHHGATKDCALWAPFELAVLRRLLRIANIADALDARDSIIEEEMGPLRACTRCSQRAENWRRNTTNLFRLPYGVKNVPWTAFEA